MVDSPANRRKRASETLKDYQTALEEVLAWLLGADEKLLGMAPVDEADMANVKKQFTELEEFMLQLRDSQEAVGKVLKRGTTLATSNRLKEESQATVVKQITVVNERWEHLRSQAMLRQTQLQQSLLKLQQSSLDEVTKWLAGVMAKIEASPPMCNDADETDKIVAELKEMQTEVHAHEASIYALSEFVAVVDDQTTKQTAAYTDMETAMASIGDQWMTVCKVRYTNIAQHSRAVGRTSIGATRRIRRRRALVGRRLGALYDVDERAGRQAR